MYMHTCPHIYTRILSRLTSSLQEPHERHEAADAPTAAVASQSHTSAATEGARHVSDRNYGSGCYLYLNLEEGFGQVGLQRILETNYFLSTCGPSNNSHPTCGPSNNSHPFNNSHPTTHTHPITHIHPTTHIHLTTHTLRAVHPITHTLCLAANAAAPAAEGFRDPRRKVAHQTAATERSTGKEEAAPRAKTPAGDLLLVVK